MLDFGRWIVEVAVNGVKSGSFDRAWAAMQLSTEFAQTSNKYSFMAFISFYSHKNKKTP